ncbi:MAG: class IV adenylate cyclase [Acidobacteriota bacterium]|nr:class IV adenylate cyclase [Acidobacteriota bacterium]MDH3529236.1 class IV adenylate cyclase [Acidobacteriota bacterium]
MAIEIEKKYRLTASQFADVENRLEKLDAVFEGRRFERNILFSNVDLLSQGAFVRLRRLDEKTILTFKKKLFVNTGLKTQLEFETEVGDSEEVTKIIEHLGLKKDVVYEKKRAVWRLDGVEIVLDELPFGLYMEIEGDAESITLAEVQVGAVGLVIEPETYPILTRRFGEVTDGVTQSVFGA